MAPSESTARFYFQLTYSLAKEDLTKFDRINEMNIYLCLNTASIMKDRIIQQQNELKAIQNQPKEVR
jgi:hypothetical protein